MTRRTKIKLITYGTLIGFMLFLALLFYLTTYYEAEYTLEEFISQADIGEEDVFIYRGEDFTALIPASTFSGSFPGSNRGESGGNGFNPSSVKADRGLVFYPGAKVEGIAYSPLLLPLIARGYPVIILKFPFHFAILEQNAGHKAMPQFSSIGRWTLSGHSLGGTVAGWEALENYKERNGDDPPDFTVDSMIYLASYSNEGNDLSDSDLTILSVAGERDGLISLPEIRESMNLYPDDAKLITIYGGNHAQFGSYGPQAGDAAAGISPEAQQERATQLMLEFLQRL